MRIGSDLDVQDNHAFRPLSMSSIGLKVSLGNG